MWEAGTVSRLRGLVRLTKSRIYTGGAQPSHTCSRIQSWNASSPNAEDGVDLVGPRAARQTEERADAGARGVAAAGGHSEHGERARRIHVGDGEAREVLEVHRALGRRAAHSSHLEV